MRRFPIVRYWVGAPGPDAGCDATFETLDRWADSVRGGGGPWPAYPALEAHLAACPDCREDAEGLLAILEEGPAGSFHPPRCGRPASFSG